MHLIKISNKIVNLDQMTDVEFIEIESKLSINMVDESVVSLKGELAVRTWEVICRLAVDAEVPTTNPWKD